MSSRGQVAAKISSGRPYSLFVEETKRARSDGNKSAVPSSWVVKKDRAVCRIGQAVLERRYGRAKKVAAGHAVLTIVSSVGSRGPLATSQDRRAA